MKYVRGFVAFWNDFIVDDAWEVAVGVALILLVLYLVVHNGAAGNEWLALLLPLLVVGLLGIASGGWPSHGITEL